MGSSATLTTDNTKCTLSGTWMLADQEQMRSACLEVVKSLEACVKYDIRTGIVHSRSHLQLISGRASGNDSNGNSETFLHSSGLYEMSCILASAIHYDQCTDSTYPLDQQHTHKVLLLSRLVYRNSTESTQKDMIERRVIKHMV